MKKLFITILLSIPVIIYAQDDSYTMLETVQLTPNGEDNDKLEAAMKAHNAAFHSSGPHAATVWSISSGPNSGTLVWVMGPLTFADLDTRPAGDDHDADWAKVMEHIEDMGTVEYWKRDDDLSNIVGDPAPSPILHMRIWKIRPGNGFLVGGHLKQASATVKAMEGENSWAVWDNQFHQGSRGRHIATVVGLNHWAELDGFGEGNFSETFKKVHGEDAWIPFVRTRALAYEDWYDEIWTLEAEMSSTQ